MRLRKSLQCWRLGDEVLVLPWSPWVFWVLLETRHEVRQAFIPDQTGGLTLFFGAVYSRQAGHHQPCMHKPGLTSCPHSMGNMTDKSLGTLSCNSIQNLSPPLQSSTLPSHTFSRPRPHPPFREIEAEHCEALCTCLPRRCLLGFPMPVTIIISEASRSQTAFLTASLLAVFIPSYTQSLS